MVLKREMTKRVIKEAISGKIINPTEAIKRVKITRIIIGLILPIGGISSVNIIATVAKTIATTKRSTNFIGTIDNSLAWEVSINLIIIPD